MHIIKYNKLIHSTTGKNNGTYIRHHTVDKLLQYAPSIASYIDNGQYHTSLITSNI